MAFSDFWFRGILTTELAELAAASATSSEMAESSLSTYGEEYNDHTTSFEGVFNKNFWSDDTSGVSSISSEISPRSFLPESLLDSSSNSVCNVAVRRPVASEIRESVQGFGCMVQYKTEIHAIQEKILVVNRMHTKMSHAQRHFEERIATIRSEVDNIVDVMITVANQLKVNWHKELTAIKDMKTKQWSDQSKKLSAVRSALESEKKLWLYDTSDAAAMNRAEIEVPDSFIPDGRVDFYCVSIKNIKENMPSWGRIVTPASPERTFITPPAKMNVGGLNTFMVTVADLLNRPLKLGGHLISATITNSAHEELVTSVEDCWDGNYRLTFTTDTEGLHRIDVHLAGTRINEGFPYEVFIRKNDVVSKFSNISFPSLVFGRPGNSPGEFCRPWGVCCDASGNIFVADRSNHRIQAFTKQGRFLFQFGCEGAGYGEFNRPTGVAVDGNGRIIVADKDNHRVQVFSSTGGHLFSFGSNGTGDGQFNYPWDVSSSFENNIAVSDSKNHRVQLFSPDGQFIAKCAFDAMGRRHFDSPRGVAFRRDGSLFVTDFNFHRVVILDKNLRMHRVYGYNGTKPWAFERPQGIAVDPDGRIAVADCKNYRVQIFGSDGELCSIFGTRGTSRGSFDCPQGICFHPDGQVVVVDFGNSRIQVF